MGEKIINENSYRAIFCIYAALYITLMYFKRNLAEIQLALAEWMNASIIDRLF